MHLLSQLASKKVIHCHLIPKSKVVLDDSIIKYVSSHFEYVIIIINCHTRSSSSPEIEYNWDDDDLV